MYILQLKRSTISHLSYPSAAALFPTRLLLGVLSGHTLLRSRLGGFLIIFQIRIIFHFFLTRYKTCKPPILEINFVHQRIDYNVLKLSDDHISSNAALQDTRVQKLNKKHKCWLRNTQLHSKSQRGTVAPAGRTHLEASLSYKVCYIVFSRPTARSWVMTLF